MVSYDNKQILSNLERSKFYSFLLEFVNFILSLSKIIYSPDVDLTATTKTIIVVKFYFKGINISTYTFVFL